MDCSPPGSSVHGDSPGKNTGVDSHALLQGIFPTQGLNPGLLHCRWILYCLSHQNSHTIFTAKKYFTMKKFFFSKSAQNSLVKSIDMYQSINCASTICMIKILIFFFAFCYIGLPWQLGKESTCNCRRHRFNSWVGKICWRRDRLPTLVFLGFSCGSAGKKSTCNVGDLGLIPGLGRCPREGKGYPLQYYGLYSPWGSK